jgi:hypothetical protein
MDFVLGMIVGVAIYMVVERMRNKKQTSNMGGGKPPEDEEAK